MKKKVKKYEWEKTVKSGVCDCKSPDIYAGWVAPDYKKLLIICDKCNKRRPESEI